MLWHHTKRRAVQEHCAERDHKERSPKAGHPCRMIFSHIQSSAYIVRHCKGLPLYKIAPAPASRLSGTAMVRCRHSKPTSGRAISLSLLQFYTRQTRDRSTGGRRSQRMPITNDEPDRLSCSLGEPLDGSSLLSPLQ
jgi:hypothetical protein